VSRGERVNVSYDEPRVFAVFKQDGTFLGEVRFPMGIRPSVVGDATKR
jgi:hypothetical protein